MDSIKEALEAITKMNKEMAANAKPVKPKTMREIYQDSGKFLDWEDQKRFEMEYPTINDFMEANGTR